MGSNPTSTTRNYSAAISSDTGQAAISSVFAKASSFINSLIWISSSEHTAVLIFRLSPSSMRAATILSNFASISSQVNGRAGRGNPSFLGERRATVEPDGHSAREVGRVTGRKASVRSHRDLLHQILDISLFQSGWARRAGCTSPSKSATAMRYGRLWSASSLV